MSKKTKKFTEEQIREANALLSKHVETLEAALEAAKKVADEFGLEFSIEPAYGMGGTYYGENHEVRSMCDECQYGEPVEDCQDCEDSSDPYEDNNGWSASSQSC